MTEDIAEGASASAGRLLRLPWVPAYGKADEQSDGTMLRET